MLGICPIWGGVGAKGGNSEFCLQQFEHEVLLLMLGYCCKELTSPYRDNTADPCDLACGFNQKAVDTCSKSAGPLKWGSCLPPGHAVLWERAAPLERFPLGPGEELLGKRGDAAGFK